MKNLEEVKKECLRRMAKLSLHDEGEHTVVGAFRKNDEVWKSEFNGILYWLDEDEQKAVAEFEQEHKGLKVYHCIKSHTEFGELLTMLYVNGKDDEQFDEDKEYFDDELQYGYTMAYVKNLDDEWCSEFGSIAFRSVNGGLQRIG